MPYFNLVRVNQWVKNLLLFAPILLAHNLSPEKFIILVIIFFLLVLFVQQFIFLMI